MSDGEGLVRSLLLVGLPKVSLERACQAAARAGISRMNTTALFKRLCRSEALLNTLFVRALSQAVDRGEKWAGLRVLAVDATVLTGPGSKGVDQGLHTVYDLSRGVPLSVELSGPRTGEHLRLHSSFGAGDIILGDRGYGYNSNFLAALQSGARMAIRFSFQSVKLYDEAGQRIWPEEGGRSIPQERQKERRVWMNEWPAEFRAVGCRRPDGEAVWLLTDLSPEDLPAAEARTLYQRRWQVELFF